uniref:Uncharacterized protein n=1 Tax=Amphimedon queenslandica TaxID=400682 RepID=A0A1X7V6N8_AMPQE
MVERKTLEKEQLHIIRRIYIPILLFPFASTVNDARQHIYILLPNFFPHTIYLKSENGHVETSESGLFVDVDPSLTWECHGIKADSSSFSSAVNDSMKYNYQHQPPLKEFHCPAGPRGKGKQSASLGRSAVWNRKGTPLVETEWMKSVEIL